MRLERKTAVSFAVSAPLFVIIITVIFSRFLIAAFSLLVLFVIYSTSTFRKKNLPIRVAKLSIILFVFISVIVPNPLIWSEQIYRGLDHTRIITSNAPCIIDLDVTFLKSSFYCGPYNWSAKGELRELSDISRFIHDNNEPDVVHYINDWENWGVFDHIATPEEVLANGADDCDGIAVVMCSLMQHRGHNAWIAEGDTHWWVVVFLKENGEMHQYNWWSSVGPAYVHFNGTHVTFPMPIYNSFFLWIFNNNIASLLSLIDWYLLVPIAFILSVSFVLFVGYPRGYTNKIEHVPNILFGTVWLSILLIGVKSIDIKFGLIFIWIMTSFFLFVVDRDYITRLIKRRARI